MAGKRRGDRRGFTLMELLVTLAIVGLAVVAVGTFNFINQRQTLENKRLTELQDDMRYTVESIVPYVRMGGDLEVSGDTVTVHIPPQVYSQNFVFGFNRAAGTVWVRDVSQPVCSHIGEMHVSVDENTGLVSLELVSVSDLPGVRHGLPLTLETSVMLRNR